jgi:dipeptidase E
VSRTLLLISSSVVHGSGYLDHAEVLLRQFLGKRRRLLFVPYALADWAAYAAKVRERFTRMDVAVGSIHEAPDPVAAVEGAEALFIGGGNTFRLLTLLCEKRLIAPIRKKAAAGMPYVGSSAGTNMACPTIKTTNDMPIVCPPTFDALGLIPFQINPHYLDPDPTSKHQGETRDQRIREFHEMNDVPVVGLREGSILRVQDQRMELLGATGARLFRKGREPEDLAAGARLDTLLT